MNELGFFNPFNSEGGGGGGSSEKIRYSIDKVINEASGETTYKLMQSINNGTSVPVGEIIGFRGDQILVNYNNQLTLLNTAISNIEQLLNKTYNFTTFAELNIDTHNKTLTQITNELIQKNLPTNTIVTGQLYTQALPFSGNGEAEVIVNHPAYWWKCGSLNVAPYSWTAITGSSSWGDNGLVMDWTPTAYTLPIASGETLGGIKVGNGLTIENGVLSVDEGTPEETITYEDIPPIDFESNGKAISEYSIYGNMSQVGVPSTSTPIYPLEVGDLVTSGEHIGKYAITIEIGGTTKTIYLDEPIRKKGNSTDTLIFDGTAGTVTRKIEKLVLDGTEPWGYTAGMHKLPFDSQQFVNVPKYLRELEVIAVCSHYTPVANQAQASINNGELTFLVSSSGANNMYIRDTSYADATAFKAYLAAQYAANTPVCVWYIRATDATETVTVPTLTPSKGSNTLVFDTTLQPSYASITCTIGGGNPTPANKVSYSNSSSGLKATNVQEGIDELATIPKQLYGIGYAKDTGDLATGESLILDVTNCKKNNTYSFMAKVTSFSKILIGQGFETYSGAWAEITDTKLIVHNYAQSDTVVEYTHGLTISDYIYVQIFVNVAKADIVIYSNGNTFKQQNVNWFACNGTYFAKSDGSTLTNCIFTWSSPDFRKSIWLFGDSYIGLNNLARWGTYLRNAGYADNVFINGYAGEASSAAITALINTLKLGKPQKLVWCLGMNDGADSGDTPSANYSTSISQVETICNANNIELIYATIPSVPNQSNEAKNAYVRGTGNRYIDFAKAVGASSSGVWYTGMLNEDNVHPTETGAIALYHQALADCPELTFPNP